jgi:Cof subfamily protein (haloacid dehalogenase superfamily)
MTTFLGTKLAKIHFTSHFSEYYCIFARIKNKESHRTMEKAKQIPYRAIALDLDGTLTNHEKVVTPKTREALLQAASQGAVIILASGRPTYGIEPVAECLELQKRGGYILSYNGGNIVNAKTGEKLFSQFLPDEVIPELYAYAKEHGHALLGYAGNEIITEMPDDQYVKEESRINKMNIRKVDNLFEFLEPHPTKLLMTGDPTLMLKAEEELVEKLGDRMDIFRSAPFFLELVPKGIDKAKSLTRLLTKINLTPADLIAFGDGYNDLSMLKLAGMGVAMENAAPEVRAEADYVTLSNEEDGVAAALTHFNM